jgi:hypothetical protein
MEIFMKWTSAIILVLFLAGCGTSSTKIMNLPPLAEDAPVQVFYSEPNIKYEKVCEIKAVGNNSFGASYTTKEDFKGMFEKEARKCGANGAIFSFLSGFSSGSVTAYATGIRITSQEANLDDSEKIKAFSMAIQAHDEKKVRQLLNNVSKNSSERAPTDDEMVNLGLYIASLGGLECDGKIVELLENEYGGYVPKYNAVTIGSDSDTPLCKDVIAKSLPKMKNQLDAVVKTNNHYIGLLKYPSDDFEKRVAAYNKLLVQASKLIVEGCERSDTDPVCAVKAAYIHFADQTKVAKSSALKKNARDILKVLGN